MPESFDGPLGIAFSGDFAERVPPDVLADALEALLETYPDAPVATLRRDGLMVAVPETIALRAHSVLSGRAGLDLVEVDDASMAGWERILRCGAAAYTVHPAGRPEATWTIYGLDLYDTHGVIFMLSVPDGDKAGRQDSADALTDFTVRAPRLTTVLQDQLAFIRSIEPSTVEMLGWPADEMLGRRSTDFIHPDDQELARDAWMDMLRRPGPGRRVRLRHRRCDDSWLWLEVTNHNLLGEPEEPRVVCEMVDISEEMAAHELLHRLAEAVPVGLLQLDQSGGVVYSNERLHQILGVQRQDTFASQLASLTPAHQQLLREAVSRSLGDGSPADVEVELCDPDTGSRRCCTVGLRALKGADSAGGVIACFADITDSIRMREELRHRSMYDELTSCLNRRTILQTLEDQIRTSPGNGTRAVMFLDLDCFKPINDEHGHGAGDELLRAVADELRRSLRERDAVGRMGGDEFLIVCPDVPSAAEAMCLAERTAAVQREQVRLGSVSVRPCVSIGVAWSRGRGLDREALIAQADEAMYESKREGAGKPKLFQATTTLVSSGEDELRRRHTRAPAPQG